MKVVKILSICLIVAFVFVFHGRIHCAVANAAQKHDIVVLTYHQLEPSNLPKWRNDPYVLPMDVFLRQMNIIKQSGYHVVSLQNIDDYLNGKSSLPAKALAITFDDGYESNFLLGLPVLKHYGYHATVFLIGKVIRPKMASNPAPVDFQKMLQGNFNLPIAYDPAKESFLTWSEVAAMANSGYFDFGSHTYNAHTVPRTNIPALSKMSFSKIDSDFSTEENIFKQHKVKMMPIFAYPEGYSNWAIRGVLIKRGYELGMSSKPGRINAFVNSLLVPRFSIESSMPPDALTRILKV